MKLRLFLRRFDAECTYVFSLMNYNKLPFELFVEHDLSSVRILRASLPKETTLPLMQVAERVYRGSDEILAGLREGKLLRKGLSYSVWEKQGLESLRTEIQSAFPPLTRGFLTKFQISYKNLMGRSPRNTAEALGYMYIVLKDTVSLYKKEKRGKGIDFDEAISHWSTQLASNEFHGGVAPHLPDFLMYSYLYTYWLSCQARLKPYRKVLNWKENMDLLVDQ